MRKETSTVLYEIVDDSDTTRFAVWSAASPTAPFIEANPTSFGGSHTVISSSTAHNTAEGRWFFDSLPQGTYEILITWPDDASGVIDGEGQIRVDHDNQSLEYIHGQNLRLVPTDTEQQFGDQWNSWRVLRTGLSINEGEPLEVFLHANNGKVKADAVRLNRIVSSEYDVRQEW